jgi:hypothetical protein
MIAVALVWAGIALGAAGALALLRPLRRLGIPTRRRALLVLSAALAALAAGALLPAPLERAGVPATRLDAQVPEWQFDEFHEIRVHASPERVEAAIRAVTAGEIRLFRLLTWIRHPRWPWSREAPSILAAPADRPILDTALASGFFLVDQEPGRELVIGTVVIAPRDLAAPDSFAKLTTEGTAKAAMNFEWRDAGGGWTRLTTTTRVVAYGAGARRRFAAYWRVIYPGSALIRRTWLAAIRDRAERAPGP